MPDDRRLIEDYLPIEAISAEASREKNVRKGHISTLHLWWARRPLVACRAAVYGALVPASQFVPDNGPDNKKQSLGRANAAKFVTELCQYPGSPRVIQQAQEHILDAHADRLSAELAEAAKTDKWPSWVDDFKWPREQKQVTRHDIEKGRAPRPRVLDMFAGGGAIPLEALRLGCEAYALDLNPVAHIIQLCTLVYPQKYGQPDPTARGMTGPPGKDGMPTWGGLAEEVRYWGNWVLEKVRAEIGDLYPLIPDPAYKSNESPKPDRTLWNTPIKKDAVPPGYLIPVAYLWTRTVKCKNPGCGATVPLVKQTWLRKKKKGPYVAAAIKPLRPSKRVSFHAVIGEREDALGFDPSDHSKGGNATCPFCGTVADLDYIKEMGWSHGLGDQALALVCIRPSKKGKVYFGADDLIAPTRIGPMNVRTRLIEFCQKTSFELPSEPIANQPQDSRKNTLGITVRPYGVRNFGDLFTDRQMLTLANVSIAIGGAFSEMVRSGLLTPHATALTTMLALALDKMADYSNRASRWGNDDEGIANAYSRQVLTMVWDFAEASPWSGLTGSLPWAIDYIASYIEQEQYVAPRAHVMRGSATNTLPQVPLDAVVTDPPYYDNVPYADISDLFYVWLKRSIGFLYPEHFATPITPKKHEAISDKARHGDDTEKARAAYESMMESAFRSVNGGLKPNGVLTVVYAHKTTLGWSTLVDALRRSNFTVVEAWPLDTESKGRLRGHNSSALASSIFLTAKKRAANAGVGSYEHVVRPNLEEMVRERVATLWEQGITGADLVIASVGAGLRAFTKYERVEFGNGEEVPAERFLAEVEGVVLDVMLEQIAGKVARGVTAVDPASRFYVLWRYVYKAAAIDAGEAIVFANGTHVELDGQKGLAGGRNALVAKEKSTYRLREFADRGDDEKLGLPTENGEAVPLVDVLHRVLWLMEHRPRKMSDFFREARVNRDQLRVLAQALSGPALKGGELGEVSAGSELAALTKLTANWKSVVEDALSPLERGARA
ncbi:MAG: DUF1156 domain-containing protein [Nitrospira sp. CR2.1]|nr:DUF1156 domain-containing protein [Nitrospira sp. CR2.1]